MEKETCLKEISLRLKRIEIYLQFAKSDSFFLDEAIRLIKDLRREVDEILGES